MGRPAKPIELKRRNGNPGKRALPKMQTVVALPMAMGVPPLPDGVELRLPGSATWKKIWSAGALWISPATDLLYVVSACRMADAAGIAWERYEATRDAGDLRGFILAETALESALSSLGFDPTARSKLGVAEVRAMSKLEDLRVKRTKRETSAS